LLILDTNVVSELRRRPAKLCDPHVSAWSDSVDLRQTFISVVTILELRQGILSLARRDKTQSDLLNDWLMNFVLPQYDGRVLPVDANVALRCAALHVPNRKPERDAWIAATAFTHGLTVVTRNERDFAEMGVAVFNPWNFTA
jgi:predicted nucleic acid-binding protein